MARRPTIPAARRPPPRWQRALHGALALLLVAGLWLLAAPPSGSSAAPERTAPLSRIEDRAAFDGLARLDASGRYLELPQVLFALDRSTVPPTLYWIDAQRYPFHIDFLRARYLVLSDDRTFNDANYSNPDRRFVLGSVLRYPRLGRFGMELWEGDVIEAALLKDAMAAVQAGFFAPLTFKPNSPAQAAAAAEAGLPIVAAEDAYGSREQLVLNPGQAVGRLVDVASGAEDGLLPGDIALLHDSPIRLPPVAGIVSSQFSTPISHVNLLAKSWGIPNAYRADARTLFAALVGRQVLLDTRGAEIVLRPASAEEAAAAAAARAARAIQVPEIDRRYDGLPALTEVDAQSPSRVGAKAAHLAQVAALAELEPQAGFTVPAGFGVPFPVYERFVAANGLAPRIDAMLADSRYGSDADWRHAALAELRAGFARGTIPAADLARLVARRQALLGTGGVFVRSSTNAEDLAGFNGAGLYDTVPNVPEDPAALAAAVQAVWGSLWNDRAVQARMAAGIDERAVRAAVLVQVGVDAQAAGVMTTLDPFAEQEPERRVFIAAKRGLGIRVVEGRKIAEQLIYRPELDSIQVLTRSADDTMLSFAPGGGVQEIRVEQGRAILSDPLVRRLATVALRLQALFDARPQDVEWLTVGDRIVIVQSRDYVRGAR